MAEKRFTEFELELLETLAGRRPRAQGQQAVRVDDLTPLLQLKPIKSVQVSGDPTEAEFNLLLADFLELRARVDAVIAMLTAKIRR